LRARPSCGTLIGGKGGKGKGTKKPAELELNPAVDSSPTKENSHGQAEEVEEGHEEQVEDEVVHVSG
jgi:hypothetical protein